MILGKEITMTDLVPIFNGFLRDLDEVRVGVLKHLADFLKVRFTRVLQIALRCVVPDKFPLVNQVLRLVFVTWQVWYLAAFAEEEIVFIIVCNNVFNVSRPVDVHSRVGDKCALWDCHLKDVESTYRLTPYKVLKPIAMIGIILILLVNGTQHQCKIDVLVFQK